MKAYPQELRLRILQKVDEGKTQVEVAHHFRVSKSTVKRYVRQKREKGHVQPKPIPGRPSRKRLSLEAKLPPQQENLPDATLQQLCDIWEAQEGIKVRPATQILPNCVGDT